MIRHERIQAKHVMRAPVLTLAPDDTIERALELFEDSRIGGAPVVDADGNLAGMLSLSDVARTEHVCGDRIELERGGFEMAELTGEERTDEIDPDEVFFAKEDYSPELLGRDLVADWMTADVISVAPDATLEQVCGVMSSQRIHRVPVTDGKRLVGWVTSFDVVRALADSKRTRRAVRT